MLKRLAPLLISFFIALSGLLPATLQADGANLIPNPSVETANSGNTAPVSWQTDSWGNNSPSFSYKNEGHSGNRSLYLSMSKYSSGDAKWYFEHVDVSPNTNYTFSDYYKSNTATEVDIEYTNSAGKLSYAWLGDTAASPNSWSVQNLSFTTPSNVTSLSILHIIYSDGWLQTDDYSLTSDDGTTPPPPIDNPPIVNITSPSTGTTVSGNTNLAASASDDQAVASVQFRVDGTNVGPAETSAPYNMNWDSTSVSNGSHTLTAVATDTSGLTATSSPVTLNIQNQATPPPPTVSANLIPNPSVETANSGNTAPVSWQTDSWGNNSPSFSYKNEGHSGNRSLYLSMSKYSSGDAKWYFEHVTVKGGTRYNFSDFYKSNLTTELDIEYKDTAGKLSYVWLGNPVASSSSWNSASYSFTTPANVRSLTLLHIIYSNGWLQTDDYSLTEDGVTPPPVTNAAPTVSLTAPVSGTTLSGPQTIVASASDDQGIKNVQFRLDGNSLAAADATAPYSYNWDTTTVSDGSHTLTAVATDTGGLSTESSPVAITVHNESSPPPVSETNLIPNASLETAQDANTPASWFASNWGNNSASFSYLDSGHTGSRSVEAKISSYSSGAANWYYADVPVTSGKTYQYSNWYKANVDTEVDAEVTMNDGTLQYFWLGNVLASSNWTQFKSTFTVPSGAKSMAIYQILAKVGYVISDDYSMSEYTPLPFNRPLISITFDDGWSNQYQNAFPLLQKYDLDGTFYIISGELDDQPDYMSASQVKNLYAAGNEIASHTVSHPDLTTLSQAQITSQMQQSQTTLQSVIDAPITDFAYPYGAYNGTTISIGSQYYQSQRTVNDGLNTRDNLDLTLLKIHEVDSNISQAQVKQWVDQAIASKSWLILVYHEIATTPTDPTDSLYMATPSDLDAELGYIRDSDAGVVTVRQAINEILPQL